MLEFFSFLILPLIGAIKAESYPNVLSEEEEALLLLRHKNKDLEARNQLILHNLRLVAHIAKKYENSKEDKDDILSIGIQGLIKAVDTFSFEANNKLSTYAAKCIENEILMSFRSNKNKFNYSYLFDTIGIDKDGNEIELMDIIKDPKLNFYEELENDDTLLRLKEALVELDERELEIIKLRYGLDNHKAKTQKEIAKELNISRSYVSRIEKRALMKLYFALTT